MTLRLTPAEAIRRIAPRSTIVPTGGCSTAETLLRELGEASTEIAGLTLQCGLLLGTQPFSGAVRSGSLALRTWHVVGGTRELVRDGIADYIPLRGNDVPDWLPGNVDVLLARVSPPDSRGYCSFGPSTSFSRAAVDAASLVIAEVDEALPFTMGESLVHIDEIDVLTDADTPTCTYESAPTSEASDRIADLVLGLFPKNATLQFGVGAVPETVSSRLAEAGLGHITLVGMGCDSMVGLLDQGRARAAKTGKPLLWTLELLGTRQILDAADKNPAVFMLSSSMCHSPKWIGTFDRFVSINSAVEVDLFGQVSSETVGGQAVAGIGGSMDFFEGAHLSGSAGNGGLRIVALQSTTPNGKISKISSFFPEGTPVTIPRHSVDFVVTEHGVARLFGRSVRERAEALIEIAAPQHRGALADSLHAMFARKP